VNHRRLFRFVAVVLLAWIALDLAAIDTCALDADKASGRARTSVAALDSPGPGAHPHTVLRPDHCFCHGLSTGAYASPALMEPFRKDGVVPDTPPGHPRQVSSALYHPPQLPA
jgi:hypothetical protein